MDRFALLAFCITLLAACDKDSGSDGSRDGDDVRNWIYHQDSSCMMIPNVITPNNDGINDRFWVSTNYLADIRVIILDSQQRELFRTYDPYEAWDGRYGNGTLCSSGMYFYDIRATSLSGIDVRRAGHFHLIRDVLNECIHGDCLVLTPDMFDPRRCGDLYTGNDPVRICD